MTPLDAAEPPQGFPAAVAKLTGSLPSSFTCNVVGSILPIERGERYVNRKSDQACGV
jgi:hypothetical protein